MLNAAHFVLEALLGVMGRPLMPIDDYFQKPSAPTIPPDARRWEIKRRAHHKVICEFSRERDGLVFLPAELFVFFSDTAGGEVDSDKAAWDAAA